MPIYGSWRPFLSNSVKEWIALEDEAARRRPRHDLPRLQCRQIGIVVAILLALQIEQRHPIPLSFLCGHLLQFRLFAVTEVERLEVVRRRIDVVRPRPRQGGKKERVGLLPGVSHRGFVDHLETRRPAVDQQEALGAARREVTVVGDILPVETEILCGERLAVRPAMSPAEMQREDAPLLNVHSGEQIGDHVPLRIIAHQPRIAVDDHHARVLRLTDQHAQLAAVSPRREAGTVEGDDGRIGRKPLLDRRQQPCPHRFEEAGRFDIGGAGEPGREGDHCEQKGEGFRAHTAGLAGGRRCALTKWPPPRSNIRGEPASSSANGGGQAAGIEARPSISAEKSRRRAGSG